MIMSLKQREIKFKPRIKLNHNTHKIYTSFIFWIMLITLFHFRHVNLNNIFCPFREYQNKLLFFISYSSYFIYFIYECHNRKKCSTIRGTQLTYYLCSRWNLKGPLYLTRMKSIFRSIISIYYLYLLRHIKKAFFKYTSLFSYVKVLFNAENIWTNFRCIKSVI